MLDAVRNITNANFIFFQEDSIVRATQSNCWVKNVIFMFPHFAR